MVIINPLQSSVKISYHSKLEIFFFLKYQFVREINAEFKVSYVKSEVFSKLCF